MTRKPNFRLYTYMISSTTYSSYFLKLKKNEIYIYIYYNTFKSWCRLYTEYQKLEIYNKGYSVSCC